MDKLEKYIVENRDKLDRYSPDSEIWARINTKEPFARNLSRRFLKYAAALIILFATAIGIHGIRNIASGNLLSPELLESELYYSNKVEGLIREAQPLFTSNPDLQDELMLEISMLDSIYLDLKKDLKDNVSNSEVIEALILNYRVKIEILEEMLEMLKDENIIDENKISHEL